MRTIPVFFFLTASLAAETIVVSPQGPVKSPAEARDAARALRRKGAKGVINIQFRGGRYFLTGTLSLSREDSNTTYEAAPGERVVFSGGRVVSGWKKEKGAIWSAPAGESYFHQLFVGGRRAQRARTPDFGFLRIDGASSQDKPFHLKFRGHEVKKEWAGRGDVEVVALLAWADLRMPIVSIDETTSEAVLTSDPRPSNREKDARYYIENAPDALDRSGEWYLDKRSKTVSYWPLGGEDLSREEVIAPVLTRLVELDGTRVVTFRGIEFTHADWTMPDRGYADMQASVLTATTAFEATGAEDCVIERCRFTQLGGYAISFGRGCKRNRIVHNEMFDLGGGGVKIGEVVTRLADADRNWENAVTDNHIHDLGSVFPPAVGVWVGQSSRNEITHNHIHDLYYTAISVGWTWGYAPNQCNGNHIDYNHLHDIGNEMLSDMGGIYTLGVQPGTTLRNNLIHDVAAFTYGGWGIYPDEGSSEMLIENNVVYRCKHSGFHQHYGRENIVRNNIFALNREYEVMRSRVEEHVSFRMERNILYYDQGRLLGANWGGSQYKFNHNLYWDARGLPVRFSNRSWDEWRAAGQDAESMIADPLFVNPGNFDFRLKPGSPALKLGFKPIDMSTVGVREK